MTEKPQLVLPRPTRRTPALALGLLAAAVALPASLPASAQAAEQAGRVVTGSYAGTTSEGQPIRFKLVAKSCEAARAPYKLHKGVCFVGSTYNAALEEFYPKVLEHCSDGSTLPDPLYIASYQFLLSTSGQYSSSQPGLGGQLTGTKSVSSLAFHTNGGTITGSLRQTESYDTGGGPVMCDSKPVTFKARKVK